MKRSELKEAIKAEIKSVLSENENKSAVHSLGKDLYDYLTNTFKLKGHLSSPIKADTINKGEQFTVLINDNGGKFDKVTLRVPVGKRDINPEWYQKNIVDKVKNKYKELKTKISQDKSSGGNRAIVDFTLTGPNLFQKVTEEIKSVLSEEEKKFQMTYKGDPVHIKVQGFGGNEEGAKDTVLFVNVGGIGKRESKASKNALEKRLGLLDKKVDKIMFTDKDNISKEIKDISPSDFKITSVLLEEIQVGDIVTLGGDGDELEVIDSREMFGSDMMAHRVKFPNGDTAEYSADQLRPARMMNEGKKGVVVDPDEIMMHINQYQSGNIDGDDLAQAIEEILVAMMNKSVSFSDIREAKSAADVDKEVKDLESKMVEKAKEYKAAEGEKKEKIKDELKDMTTKRNDLKKKVKDLKKKEEKEAEDIGRGQELDT